MWFYSAASVLFAYIGWELSSSGFDIISGHGGFPWLYQNGFIATIYLALGGIYWKYEKFITKHLTCFSIIPLAVLYLIGSSEYMKDYVSCTTSMCSINILGVLCSFIGTILLIELCKIIPNSSFMTYVGKNSIGFYFLCGALPAIISIVLTHLFSVISFYIVLISCALCITIAYITVRLLNRYFPFIFDLRLLFNRK